MNSKLATHRFGAFGLLDLLILIGTAALVVLVLLPMLAKSRARSSRISCVNNLKQVGLSFRIWADDNGGNFPMHVSTNAGGSREWVAVGAVAPHFAVMSNELATPRILVCPEDARRQAATNFAALRASQISYFVVPEANEALDGLWLAGDRNLSTNGKALSAGTFTAATNTRLAWLRQPHRHGGNLAFADGRVQQVFNPGLPAALVASLSAYPAVLTNATLRTLLP